MTVIFFDICTNHPRGMKVTQVYEVSNNQIVILLPDSFKNQKSVRVTLENTMSRKEKLSILRSASNDPMFLADIQSVQSDFEGVEFENL